MSQILENAQLKDLNSFGLDVTAKLLCIYHLPDDIRNLIEQNGGLATRLDAARRFGGILAAADAGRLTLCEASMSQNISRGLSPINAVSLARLLLTSSEESDSATRKKQ